MSDDPAVDPVTASRAARGDPDGRAAAEGLTRRFGSLTALDGLSFSVPPGQVVGFLGPNGAGKTTTMRAVFGLTTSTPERSRGTGRPVGAADRRRFGYMPEERGLYPGMHVGEQLEYLGRLHGLSGRAAHDATSMWLDRLGIGDRADSKVDALSHGNQQRVQLAAALVHRPELLVLDEPLAGLDPSGIDAIGEVLVEQARSGCSVLFSSHQLDQVEDLCESVTIIDHGRLVVTGRVDDLTTAEPAVWSSESTGTATPPGRVASPGSPSPRSPAVRRDSCSTSPSTATRCSGRRWSAGRVTAFVFERRRLSEVFREAIA